MEVEIRHFHSPAYLKFMKISVIKEKKKIKKLGLEIHRSLERDRFVLDFTSVDYQMALVTPWKESDYRPRQHI